jgi:cytochrome c oxidase subunit II
MTLRCLAPLCLARIAAVLLLAAIATPALAQTPYPWQMGLQAPHSPVQAETQALNALVLYIIIAIVVFVACLLLYCIVRFNHRANPIPSRTSHNTVIEILWTTVPVLILIVIAVPSFRLVYYQDRTTHPDMTIKVTAHQWYWEYTYPEQGGLDFQSYMIPEKQLKPEQRNLRQLAVDNPLVVPVGKNVRVLLTSGDVLHDFFIPSLGVQRYAIPGRIIETWFRADQPGDYYGECNQICGINHDAMSIAVHAVTEAEYETWLKTAKNKFSALSPARPQRVELAAATWGRLPVAPGR